MTGERFADGTALWFWWIEVDALIRAGARPSGPGTRPCTHADVLVMLDRLHRRGRLTAGEVAVLVRYGREGREPDCDHPAERAHAEIWRRALGELEREAMSRGVVEAR